MRFIILSLFITTFIFAQTGKNGRIFDQGLKMTRPSSDAPAGTEALQTWLGDWDVTTTVAVNDTTQKVFKGQAHISLFNRGHGYIERYFSGNYQGSGKHYEVITMLVKGRNVPVWSMGIADGYKENCSVFSGNMMAGKLVLYNSERPRGSIQLQHYRATWTSVSENNKRYTLQSSTDGDTWSTVLTKEYLRGDQTIVLPDSGAGYGVAAKDRAAEADQFDFLVGEWKAMHDMYLPQAGRRVQWRANATAVFTLDGRAVMEYNWFNTDPNLPEAATTIIRMYNRAMRRWENLFVTNRFNTVLHFGGVKDENRIILTAFQADAAQPYSYWIFHDMQQDSYKWHSLNTSDRGETTTQNWKIEFTRKP